MNTPSNSARDTFLYLMALITLVASAVSLGALAFQIINNYFPDPTLNPYYWGENHSIRYAMATLIVTFPVFLGVARFIKKDLIANPEKGEMKIRRWLLYLTVFAAALVIIGDLVGTLLSFLNGELTIRFALKALTIFGISFAAFYYYLRELRWQPGMAKQSPGFMWGTILIVIAAVISGFIITGSPYTQRLNRLDFQKVNDLSILESELQNWWAAKGSLPGSLEELKDKMPHANIRDSQTGQIYEYTVRSQNPPAYTMCAVFNRNSDVNNNVRGELSFRGFDGNRWAYKEGRSCFNREIDKDLVQPIRKAPPILN